MQTKTLPISIPTKIIGPIKMNYLNKILDINVPVSTIETPLFYSIDRGATVSQQIKNGFCVTVETNLMTRSIILEANSAKNAIFIKYEIEKMHDEIDKIVQTTSRFTKLINTDIITVAKLLYIRFSMDTDQASGHNMTTKAANLIIKFLLAKFELKYISISANICTDKKVSSINSIKGRGKKCIVDAIISRDVCQKILKTTPEKIVELNNKKNLIGSIISGSICSANAHFANILAAIYLSTGQDIANIVEGSQGITYAELTEKENLNCENENQNCNCIKQNCNCINLDHVNNDCINSRKNCYNLYFSVTIPNVIVGTIGNGKDADYAVKNLQLLGCHNDSEKLAAVIACAVCCAELSLLAVLTNMDELCKSHMLLERNEKK